MVDGGQRTDMDCLACAMVNWYLVTYEVAVVGEVVPSMEVATPVMDAMKVVVDEVRNRVAAGEVHDSIATLAPAMNSIPVATDAILTLAQDSQCPDDRDIRMGAYQDGRTEVMQCFRALEAASCCCCCCYPDCLDSA